MSDLRPVPDDFAAYAPMMGIKAATKRWSAGVATINRWERESGVLVAREKHGASTRPVPDDFADIVNHTPNEAAARWGCSHELLHRWRRETGLSPKSGRRQRASKIAGPKPPAHNLRPIPDDLAEMAKTHSMKGLARLYNAGCGTVTKWLRSKGITANRNPPSYVKNRPIRAAAHRAPQPAPIAPRDDSLPARAAAFLARDTACFPEKVGLKEEKTGAWWWGNLRFATADEMVARAERKGFRVGGEMVG